MAYLFPRWTNKIPTAIALGLPVIGAAVIFSAWYWASPQYTDVGYEPVQPVPFSHRLHAGDMGIDCRYCHNTVEVAARAAIPPTDTCMNCHRIAMKDSPNLKVVRESEKTGDAIPWVRVHQLPDYAYFDHSIHLAAGVGCGTCHGRVDQMDTVRLVSPMSMSGCLDCHRNPTPKLGPKDAITRLDYSAKEAGYDPKLDPSRTRELTPPEHCSGCHR